VAAKPHRERKDSSFLKKRGKKVLSVSGRTALTRLQRRPRAIDKSLFASFSSEKEDLPSLP
jgi:hypothetical protein